MIKVVSGLRGKRIFLYGRFEGVYLTEREFDILKLIKNLKYKEIAKQHNLSTRTIESYVNKIKTKLGCSSKYHLIDILDKEGVFSEIEKCEIMC